jgi:5-formyltetrahydrofolate cyclo-ligase
MSGPRLLRSEKRALRRTMELRREQAHAKNREAAFALRDNFLKNISLSPRCVIASYSACGSEMDPAPLVEALRMQGHAIALPVVMGKTIPLVFRIYERGDPLVPGVMDIPEPIASACLIEPAVLLVPLLAFDQRKYRLGNGGGYYDRTLTELRSRKDILAIGIGYAAQEVPEVPAGPRDARLDKIITEIRLLN